MSSRADLKCKIEKCTRAYRDKGYCNTHYKKWRAGEFGLARYKTCKTEACNKPLGKFGMCDPHHEAWAAKRKGASAAPSEAPAAEEAAPAEENAEAAE